MGRVDIVERIEAAALWAWPPRETAYVEGWLLRAAGGRLRRVNSVRTLAFTPGADLDGAIRRVEAWYAARGLPACFQPTARSQPPKLEAALAERGYAALPPVSVRLIDPAAVPEPTASGIDLLTRPTPGVMNTICDPQLDRAARQERAALFARIRRPHVFGLVSQAGEPVATGLCVLDGELAGIFAMRTAVPHRGQGHARQLFQRLAGWARAAGARQLYLQVEDDNAPAVRLYGRFGGHVAYRYWYREQAP